MSHKKTYHIVINPASAGGRTVTMMEEIVRLIERHISATYTLCVTQAPLDATRSVVEAVTQGVSNFLLVGGDGTINEVAHGLMQGGLEAASNCTLGIISSGSGEGLARSLGLPHPLADQIHVALNGEAKAIDVAKISFTDSNDCPAYRYFVNECQIGFGAEVVRRTTLKRKRSGGLIGYGLRSLSLIFQYQPSCVTIVVDGRQRVADQVLGVAIGNGAITAGGMRLTPNASLNDGSLDILIIHEQSIAQRIVSFSKIYSGNHISQKHFDYLSGTSITFMSDSTVYVSADGELLGHLPCTIEIVPAALRLRKREKSLEGHHAHSIEQLETAGI